MCTVYLICPQLSTVNITVISSFTFIKCDDHMQKINVVLLARFS